MSKDLRRAVSRKSHSAWKPPSSRPDPIAILKAADVNRLPELVPIRYGRMLRSPFAFYRGSASIMASDLSTTPSTGIVVQSCGDCHLMNFGGFATPERNVIFDINDFDETHPAPWEWDVKRLAASFVLAGRSNGFDEDVSRNTAVTAVRSYRERLRGYAQMNPLDVWYAKLAIDDFFTLTNLKQRARIERRIAKATEQSGSDLAYPKLAQVVDGSATIKDSPPLIFHPDVTRQPDFHDILRKLLGDYRATLSDDRRVLLDRYRVVDAAIKVVGIGSVGTNCWIALLMSHLNQPLFLQFKEANDSVLAAYTKKSAYRHNGERVVMGQRLMQAASDMFLGWMTSQDGRQFYGRQLRDAKISARIETFDPAMLRTYAQACGWSLARAHSKGGDAIAIGAYLGGGTSFDESAGDFAVAYANQAERDYGALKRAVADGIVDVIIE